MQQKNKCVNCGKYPRTNFEFLPCGSCGRAWFAKCRTLEELANEENLRDDRITDFVPDEMEWKQAEINNQIFYIERVVK